ncbi:MAG TPA: hypothetical protein VHJ20_09200 [Polyangia bacterium]|nr:hypothetical protein [Polyangia bacterium]
MRFARAGMCAIAIAAGGCAAHPPHPAKIAAAPAIPSVAGVWDGMSRTTIEDGVAAGDTRIEKQEWHLTQTGDAVSGYYIAALTFVSGDGRPYVCSREPQFSAVQRFEVAGRLRGAAIEIDETTQRAAETRCDPGARPLLHWTGQLRGDVLTIESDGGNETLYRNRAAGTPGHEAPELTAASANGESRLPALLDNPSTLRSQAPIDVSGLWLWEHHGPASDGDDKQEREEWHVTQDGTKISGYYDRVVRQVSLDGHAYRCSLSLDFEIATRYQFSGEVRGNQIVIYESSFEVLAPSACDNGKRRLDAYEGQATADELRLAWGGPGGQVLHRARPDVPTQRF